MDLILPKELDLSGPVADVLGLMIFRTTPTAHALRRYGWEIPTKTEAEQAVVLHWLLSLALEHGEGWRAKADEYIKAQKALWEDRESRRLALLKVKTDDKTCHHCGGPAEPHESLNQQMQSDATWGKCAACDLIWMCGLPTDTHAKAGVTNG